MRKLAAAALGWCAAIFLAQYLIPVRLRLPAAAVLLLLGLTAFLLRGDARTRAMLFLFPACAGLLWSWGYHQLFLAPGEALDGQTVTAEVIVTAYPEELDGYTRVYARLSAEDVPRVKTVIYDYEEQLGPLVPGDRFEAALRLRAATRSRGEETAVYTSRGIGLRATLAGDPGPAAAGRSVRYLPVYAAHFLRERICALFPADTSPFFQALLTGDRTELKKDSDLYNAMSMAGILHIVAISGMHISFLLGLIRLLSGKGKLTAILAAPLLVFFALMTGGGPSVWRAAFMQGFVLLAPLVRRERDNATSLFTALGLLLLLNPASSASAALQLSFASVAGLLAVSGGICSRLLQSAFFTALSRNRAGETLSRAICSSLSASLGATVFSFPLLAIHFGTLALYAPLSNLLCLWAVTVCFAGGYLLIGLSLFWLPLGAFAAGILSWFARWIFLVVHVVSRLPYAVLSTMDPLVVWWLIVCYGIFLLLWFFRRPEGFRPVLPVCLCLICLSGVLISEQLSPPCAAVLDVGQGACSVLTSGDLAVVLDCGSTLSDENAGRHCADYLISRGQRDVDLLALTHLHADHCNGVEELMSRVRVRHLALPANTDDSDGLRDGILACAEAHGTEILFIEDEAVFRSGELTLTGIVLRDTGDQNERGSVYLAELGDFSMMVTGDAGMQVELEAARQLSIPKLDLLAVGHHGSSGSSGGAFLSLAEPRCAVISVGANNGYGHPSEEALARLRSYTSLIFRTDLDGDVCFRLPS